MPSLTIRSFAELLNLPAHAQARILAEQKYPKQGPQSFKTPYYQQALVGIRAFYKAGNDVEQLTRAAAKIEAFTQETKRDNNLRILSSFKQDELASRKLKIAPAKHLSFTVDDVVLRFSPDLNGQENGAEQLFLLHYRSKPLEPEMARTTLELVHWALEISGSPVSTKQLEYIDLFTNKPYAITKRRSSTIAVAEQNLKIIQTLWPTL
ncbi:MAG: hypothetical protein HYX45_03000 [Burkholderiales bacterium]|mgnify:CR=1|nr:hypothetical protein [Burkholderiales bacterium]